MTANRVLAILSSMMTYAEEVSGLLQDHGMKELADTA